MKPNTIMPNSNNDILLKQIIYSKNKKSVNIIALHLPIICYCWALMYSVSRRRASLDHRSTTPHVIDRYLQFSRSMWTFIDFLENPSLNEGSQIHLVFGWPPKCSIGSIEVHPPIDTYILCRSYLNTL